MAAFYKFVAWEILRSDQFDSGVVPAGLLCKKAIDLVLKKGVNTRKGTSHLSNARYALKYLVELGLLIRPQHGHYQITEKGRARLLQGRDSLFALCESVAKSYRAAWETKHPGYRRQGKSRKSLSQKEIANKAAKLDPSILLDVFIPALPNETVIVLRSSE